MFKGKTKPSSAASYNSPYNNNSAMSVLGIQGQVLEVTVVACNKLKDTEWISRQDPYVCLEYASTKYRTRTCTDGGKNPTFQERFVFTLIEGLREISIMVWNSNTLTLDDFIGTGKVQLHKVLSQGYDDSARPLQDKRGRHAGEVRLIMHYANANNGPAPSQVPSVLPAYSTPPPHVTSYYPPMTTSYPTTTPPNSYHYPSYPPSSSTAYPTTTSTTPPNNYQYPAYPPSSSTAHPPSSSTAYPPSSSTAYPPSTSQPHNSTLYHQSTTVSYPPTYPPQSNIYPPPSTSDPYNTYPPSLYPPHPYPPPPY